MCDDVEAFVGAMASARDSVRPGAGQGWGLLTAITLPGGGKVGVISRVTRGRGPVDGR